MLKVNVGLSRKRSRDFNSSGYSVNLEGEIAASLDDSEASIERIREYYDLADAALQDQIERDESDSAIASRDVQPAATESHHSGNGYGTERNGNGHERPEPSRTTSPNGNRPDEPATNKQIQFLLTIGKRQKLSTKQLEHRVSGVTGRSCELYDLTKREAGLAIDYLTKGNGTADGNGRPRSV